jgi:hypothetical protein
LDCPILSDADVSLIENISYWWRSPIQSSRRIRGSMLWSQFYAILANFRRKNWCLYQKPWVMIDILHNLCSFVLSQKRQFLAFLSAKTFLKS